MGPPRNGPVHGVRFLAHPVLPHATQEIWEQLGHTTQLAGQSLSPDSLTPDHKQVAHVNKPRAVFPRVDKTEAFERIEAMEEEIRNPASSAPAADSAVKSASGSAPVPAGPAKIGIEDFAKIEMRVGVVKSAERVAGADKLLKLLVD